MSEQEINTKQCSPVEMRNILELVDQLRKAGIKFVPVPVLNDSDNNKLVASAEARFKQIFSASEATGTEKV